MDSSVSSCQERWTWNPECSDAGTIRLFGIRCINSNPYFHTTSDYWKINPSHKMKLDGWRCLKIRNRLANYNKFRRLGMASL